MSICSMLILSPCHIFWITVLGHHHVLLVVAIIVTFLIDLIAIVDQRIIVRYSRYSRSLCFILTEKEKKKMSMATHTHIHTER